MIFRAYSRNISRLDARISRALFVGAALSVLAVGNTVAGCSHGWEDYDPRIAGSGGASIAGSSTGGENNGGTGGMGTGGMGTGGMGTGGMGTGGMGTGGMGTGGMGTGGMGTGGSGGGVNKCGGTSVLVSDFDGNAISDLWIVNEWGMATIVQSGGELVVDLPTGNPNGYGAYIVSQFFYDFRDDFVSVEATQVTNPTNSAWMFMNVGPDDNNYIEIYQGGADLIFGQEVASTYATLKKIPYDAVAHRFWKLSEAAGKTYYQTSPDGQAWTTQLEITTTSLFAIDYSRIRLGAGADSGNMDPGKPHFDRLNGGGNPQQWYCPTNSITDDFEDGVRGPQWARSEEDQNGMLAEQGGQCIVQFTENTTDHAGYRSSRAFDLTGSSLVVEVPSVPDLSVDTHFGIDLWGLGDNEVEMRVWHGALEFAVDINDTYQKLGTTQYNPNVHRWWRIREAGNTLYWETAPDGKTWNTELEISPPPVPINMLDVELRGGADTAQVMPGQGRVDNVNLPPP